MADVLVKRGSATIAAEGTTVTLTAGVDYVAPIDTTRAYLRITGAFSNSGGAEDGEYNGQTFAHAVLHANPQSLSSTITFERHDGAGRGAVTLTYEIIEYVGAAGGANEFIVRHNEVISFPTDGSLTVDSSGITGIVNASDCVAFLTANTSDNARGELEAILATTEVFFDKVTLTRGDTETGNTDTYSLSVVEFIGSNYTIQRVEHVYTSNALETETVSVNDYTKTALYVQQRIGHNAEARGAGDNIYLSNNTTLNFDKYYFNSQVSVVYLIENPSFQLLEYSGTITGSGAVAPSSGTLPITAINDLNAASLSGVQAQVTRNSADTHHAMISMTLTDATTVSWSRGMGKYDLVYRFQVLEWPQSTPISVDRVTSRAPQYFAQADHSNQWSGSNFYTEFSIDIAADTDCLVLRLGGTLNPAVSVLIDGAPMMFGSGESDNNSAGVFIYYLMNPPTGTVTVRHNGGGANYVREYLFNELSGVDTSSTPSFQWVRGWVTNRTTTVNGGDGAFILSAVALQDTQTLDYDQTSGNTDVDDRYLKTGYIWEAYSQNQIGSGDVTISTTQAVGCQGVIVTGAFAYASGTGSTTVENSLATLWGIYQQSSNALELRFNLLQAVASSTAINWSLLQQVITDTSINWSIFNSVDGQLKVDWSVFGKIAAQLGIEYNILQAVDKSVGLDWSLLQKAESAAQLRFNLLQQAANSIGIEYNILAPVNRSFSILWDNDGSLNVVNSALRLEWSLLNEVDAALSTEWSLLSSVGVSLELRHQIAQQVAQAIETQYNIQNSVANSVELNWHSIEQIDGGLALRWSIQADQLIVPINTMVIAEENRVMTILGEDRIMKIH